MHGGIRTQGVIRHVHQYRAASWVVVLGPINSNPGLGRDVLVSLSRVLLSFYLKQKYSHYPSNQPFLVSDSKCWDMVVIGTTRLQACWMPTL